jgi:dTDP-4-amino-4,6-dideoxygalactose transaminase
MKTRLAIAGGKPAVDADSIKPWPVLDKRDREAVLRVFENGYLCGPDAPEVKALEKEWSGYTGKKYCLTTSSGTAALHMALAALKIGPGDEVIVPAYTFLASASCILHAGAIPVFVDIDRRTYNIDPDLIEEKITDSTKAVIPVHLHGLCSDMDAVKKVAKKHNLYIIEDACQAHGAEYKGKKTGSFGDLAAFSLNSSKNLSAGEGGLLVMDDDEYHMRASMLRMFGDEIDDETKLRIYNASILGYMYRNQELPAALARSQLERLDEYNDLRIKNCDILSKGLEGIKGVQAPLRPEGYKHVYWMYIVEFSPEQVGVSIPPNKFRSACEKALFAEGVQVGQWQTMPVPAQDLFQTKMGYSGSGYPWNFSRRGKKMVYRAKDYPNALDLCGRYTVVAGVHPPNGPALMDGYVEAFKKVFSDLDTVIKHADDDISAHYSGSIFRAN